MIKNAKIVLNIHYILMMVNAIMHQRKFLWIPISKQLLNQIQMMKIIIIMITQFLGRMMMGLFIIAFQNIMTDSKLDISKNIRIVAKPALKDIHMILVQPCVKNAMKDRIVLIVILKMDALLCVLMIIYL